MAGKGPYGKKEAQKDLIGECSVCGEIGTKLEIHDVDGDQVLKNTVARSLKNG